MGPAEMVTMNVTEALLSRAQYLVETAHSYTDPLFVRIARDDVRVRLGELVVLARALKLECADEIAEMLERFNNEEFETV